MLTGADETFEPVPRDTIKKQKIDRQSLSQDTPPVGKVANKPRMSR